MSRNPFTSAKFRAAIYAFVGTLLALCGVKAPTHPPRSGSFVTEP